MERVVTFLKKYIGYTDSLLIASTIIWGLNPIFVKVGLEEVSKYGFNFARFVIAAIACWSCLILIEKDWKIQKEDIKDIFIIGLIGNFIYQVLYITGISFTTAGNSSLIFASLPIIVGLINWVCRFEKVDAKMVTGMCICFIGITFIVFGTGEKVSLGNKYFYGNLLILLSTIAWAVYMILNKKYLGKYSSLKLTTYGVTVGMIVMGLAWCKPLLSENWSVLSMKTYISIIYSGALSITLAIVFWNIGVQKVGSTKTSLYNNITPVVSVICGIIFLQESIKVLQGIGTLLILSGLLLTKSKPKHPSISNSNHI